MSTSAQLTGQEKPEPQFFSGEDWEKLSPEAKIQWAGDDKWGWVVYRCSYAKEFDGPWNDLKRRIQRDLRNSILESDAPGIVENMDFIFVEDPGLENASIDELQRRFQAWARENNTLGDDLDNPYGNRGSRHGFFLRVDGEGLWNGYVGLVQGWPSPQEPVIEDGIEYPEDREDWMKLDVRHIEPYVYETLDNDENWHIYRSPPEFGPRPYW
jgi:hypothetical protein